MKGLIMNQKRNQGSGDRAKLVWRDVKDFHDPVTDACVRIAEATSSRGVRIFSMRTGRLMQDGSVSSHFPCRSFYPNGEKGTVALEVNWAHVLLPLTTAAMEWIATELQIQEDQRIAAMQAREERRFDRPKKVMPGGAIL